MASATPSAFFFSGVWPNGLFIDVDWSTKNSRHVGLVRLISAACDMTAPGARGRVSTTLPFRFGLGRAGRVFEARHSTPTAGLEDSTRPTEPAPASPTARGRRRR